MVVWGCGGGGRENRVAMTEKGNRGGTPVNRPQYSTATFDGSRGTTCSQDPMVVCRQYVTIIQIDQYVLFILTHAGLLNTSTVFWEVALAVIERERDIVCQPGSSKGFFLGGYAGLFVVVILVS
jgi:hypothetical protein